MPTINDVAKAANVSTATVSRVINHAPKVSKSSRLKVEAAMRELGYSPNLSARALATQKSSILGVVIAELTDPYFASLAQAVETVSRENHHQFLVSTGHHSADSELHAINLLIKQRCNSIVVHSSNLDDETLGNLARQHPGMVFVGREVLGFEQRCVSLDNREGGKIAARHLRSLGHSSLAMINSSYEIDDSKMRLQGFREALDIAKGSSTDNTNIIVVSGEPTLTGGEHAAQQLISTEKPFTGLFVYNDAMAIGAISVLEDNGFRVPEDVSVIGFDNGLAASYSRPKLTTIHYPIVEMARHAALLSLSLGQGNTEVLAERRPNFSPRLIKRESAARLK